MKKLLLKFRVSRRGATSIEYALIASIISISIIGALYAIQPLMQSNYSSVSSAFEQ